MVDLTGGIGPLKPNGLQDIGKAGPIEQPQKSFKDFLADSIEEVSALQNESESQIEQLVTGKTENVAEVMSAVKKAELAFDMLMEIRNKVLDAYDEVRQMRV